MQVLPIGILWEEVNDLGCNFSRALHLVVVVVTTP
jgi:hypothetical protein